MQAALEQSGILFAECLLVPWSVTVWLGSFICMAERACLKGVGFLMGVMCGMALGGVSVQVN